MLKNIHDEIDAVISTPDHTHTCIHCNANKHVYCQKMTHHVSGLENEN